MNFASTTSFNFRHSRCIFDYCNIPEILKKAREKCSLLIFKILNQLLFLVLKTNDILLVNWLQKMYIAIKNRRRVSSNWLSQRCKSETDTIQNCNHSNGLTKENKLVWSAKTAHAFNILRYSGLVMYDLQFFQLFVWKKWPFPNLGVDSMLLYWTLLNFGIYSTEFSWYVLIYIQQSRISIPTGIRMSTSLKCANHWSCVEL